ncbi:hypothetical protein ONS95_008508 [Cadophora gregata]|uniref:uncharacterized protein n=1 Tax=Cadophora gregata TaxID=51156 RepID=UPI0026DA968F|nr:uncharacterized protein ONS95_008508 [Cadophora gregata]KAK0100170.1 hypothetical protein ONS95_008508 [Cadophora gregata]
MTFLSISTHKLTDSVLIRLTFYLTKTGVDLLQTMQYEPLDFQAFEFRLLRILPASSDVGSERTLLRCSIFHSNLIEPPEFRALSYCWGDPNITKAIELDGQPFHVTTNLYSALRELRAQGYDVIWADAVCINQNDIFERGLQVMRMGLIYSKCAEVLAWLGDWEHDQSPNPLAQVARFKPLGLASHVRGDPNLSNVSTDCEDQSSNAPEFGSSDRRSSDREHDPYAAEDEFFRTYFDRDATVRARPDCKPWITTRQEILEGIPAVLRAKEHPESTARKLDRLERRSKDLQTMLRKAREIMDERDLEPQDKSSAFRSVKGLENGQPTMSGVIQGHDRMYTPKETAQATENDLLRDIPDNDNEATQYRKYAGSRTLMSSLGRLFKKSRGASVKSKPHAVHVVQPDVPSDSLSSTHSSASDWDPSIQTGHIVTMSKGSPKYSREPPASRRSKPFLAQDTKQRIAHEPPEEFLLQDLRVSNKIVKEELHRPLKLPGVMAVGGESVAGSTFMENALRLPQLSKTDEEWPPGIFRGRNKESVSIESDHMYPTQEASANNVSTSFVGPSSLPITTKDKGEQPELESDPRPKTMDLHFKQLLDFPFWKRVWIIQELSKAPQVQLMLGSIQSTWIQLMLFFLIIIAYSLAKQISRRLI